jgi:hypothetical protein
MSLSDAIASASQNILFNEVMLYCIAVTAQISRVIGITGAFFCCC